MTYHGNRKGDFPPEKKRFAGAIFLTSNLEFAKDFTGLVNLKDDLKLCNPMGVETMKKINLKEVS